MLARSRRGRPPRRTVRGQHGIHERRETPHSHQVLVQPEAAHGRWIAQARRSAAGVRVRAVVRPPLHFQARAAALAAASAGPTIGHSGAPRSAAQRPTVPSLGPLRPSVHSAVPTIPGIAPRVPSASAVSPLVFRRSIHATRWTAILRIRVQVRSCAGDRARVGSGAPVSVARALARRRIVRAAIRAPREHALVAQDATLQAANENVARISRPVRFMVPPGHATSASVHPGALEAKQGPRSAAPRPNASSGGCREWIREIPSLLGSIGSTTLRGS